MVEKIGLLLLTVPGNLEWVRVMHNNKPVTHRSPNVNNRIWKSKPGTLMQAGESHLGRNLMNTKPFRLETDLQCNFGKSESTEERRNWIYWQIRDEKHRNFMFFPNVFPRFNSIPRLNFNVQQKDVRLIHFLLLPCEDAIYIFLQLNRKLKFLLLKRFRLMFIAIAYKLMFICRRTWRWRWLAVEFSEGCCNFLC